MKLFNRRIKKHGTYLAERIKNQIEKEKQEAIAEAMCKLAGWELAFPTLMTSAGLSLVKNKHTKVVMDHTSWTALFEWMKDRAELTAEGMKETDNDTEADCN